MDKLRAQEAGLQSVEALVVAPQAVPAVRVAAKSRDDLQRVIARLREEAEGYPVAIQFENYRS